MRFSNVDVPLVADVWECSGGGGSVSSEPLGPLLSAHQHSRDGAAAEATGHCLVLPPQQRAPVFRSAINEHTHLPHTTSTAEGPHFQVCH